MNIGLYWLFILALSTMGSLAGGLCAIAGGILILYMAFAYGPKLTLFAIPVAIIFFLVTQTGALRLMNMFDVYMMKPLMIFCVIDAVILLALGLFTGSFKLLNLPAHAFLMGIALFLVLVIWTALPKQLPDLDGTDYIEIQEIHSTVQVESTDHAVFDEWLEDFRDAELVGGFQEELEFNNPNTIYRFTCMDEDRNVIAEFHFINQRHVMMEFKGQIVVYEAVKPKQLPNDEIIEFHDRILGY